MSLLSIHVEQLNPPRFPVATWATRNREAEDEAKKTIIDDIRHEIEGEVKKLAT